MCDSTARAPAIGQIGGVDLTVAQPVAGICHALGENAGLPPVWLIDLTVADLDESIRQCTQHGDNVRMPERKIPGMGRYCVIEDPAGAVAALYQSQ